MRWCKDGSVALAWAERLHRECDLCIPVNIHQVCEHVQMTLRYCEMHRDLNAIYAPVSKDRVFIVVNTVHSRNRQRYAAMHEVAHYFIDRHCPRIKADRRERFCQVFAANVLMPAAAVIEYADCDIGRLARRFQVSSEAMRIRIKELGLHNTSP